MSEDVGLIESQNCVLVNFGHPAQLKNKTKLKSNRNYELDIKDQMLFELEQTRCIFVKEVSMRFKLLSCKNTKCTIVCGRSFGSTSVVLDF